MSIRSTFSLVAMWCVLIGCSAPSPSERPPSSETGDQARVVLEVIFFDAAADSLTPAITPSTRNFDDISRRAGARHLVGRQVIANNNTLTHLSGLDPRPASEPADDIERALASYRLDVTPHVLEDGRVRLQVELELATKVAKTTVFLRDKEPIVLDNGASAEGRRLVAILRPSVIRKDADFRALLDERRGH